MDASIDEYGRSCYDFVPFLCCWSGELEAACVANSPLRLLRVGGRGLFLHFDMGLRVCDLMFLGGS